MLRRGGNFYGTLVFVSNEVFATHEWLTVPDLVEILGVSQGKVRTLIEDHHLTATRIDGVLKVPADFIEDGEPMHELHGTIILLRDCGFDEDSTVEWLLSPEDSLGTTPIEALKAGRKAEVRRIAQALL